MNARQVERANEFAALHRARHAFVLANAWDVASARVFETAGFAAIATTSSGVAASLGMADGERIELDDLLLVVRRIVEAVDVPVSVDLESGFGDAPADVGHSVERVIEAGAVGVNIEDVVQGTGLLYDLDQQRRRLEEVVFAARTSGVPLFLNARTDVYLLQVGEPETRFDETIRRVRAFVEMGADGVFVPGVTDEATIARLAKAIPLPLNVLAGPGTPPVAELTRLGVARVSLGSGPMRATLGFLRKVAGELAREGRYTYLEHDALTYPELGALLSAD